jgi:hypothetical protein
MPHVHTYAGDWSRPDQIRDAYGCSTAKAKAATRNYLNWSRQRLARAQRCGYRAAIAALRVKVSSDRCQLARLGARARAEAGSATAWNRLCWMWLVSRYRDELAAATRRRTRLQALETAVTSRRRKDGRPLSPHTLRAYARDLRNARASVADHPELLAPLGAPGPLPYHQWRRNRDAWWRRQFAGLHPTPGAQA